MPATRDPDRRVGGLTRGAGAATFGAGGVETGTGGAAGRRLSGSTSDPLTIVVAPATSGPAGQNRAIAAGDRTCARRRRHSPPLARGVPLPG